MKNLQMVLGKMEDFVSPSARDDGNFLTSVTPLRVASFATNNRSDNADRNYNGLNNSNISFDPSLAIVVFLLGSFFFAGVFSVLSCRRWTNGEGSRPGAANNVGRAATPGLDRTAIESFPVFSYNLVKGLKVQAKGSECTVCLTDFEDIDMVRLLPKCRHAFHPECIDMWLSSHTTCPVCRTSLLPQDESNPTGTDLGVVEPQTAQQEVVIVIDNGINRIDISNDEAMNGTPETSHSSARHSLVRVQKESEQTTEWYIATPRGLTPGLHRTCSFVAMMHHSQMPTTSNSQPARTKQGGSMDDAASRSRSERWGNIRMNPASLLRSFSERRVPRPAEQQDRKAYLKKSMS